ncbi:E3 ubiquitin-protein ligase RNF4 isoform X2 [Nelusetta ayraudi]|uniref:E3 ubiquitin-protein ligase RNF4 isoform X2 n=1 Tax=Nelusetta ayraudi TaxID=303726 RepID=UPI003F710FA5
MSGTVQRRRRRRVSGSPLVLRASAKSSREATSRRAAPPGANRAASASSRMASRAQSRRRSAEDQQQPTAAAQTIDAEDSVEEVVDLTCEASETSVVDLTSNDSVMLVDEGPQSRLVATGESYIVSSDEDEDTPPVVSGGVTSALQASSLSRSTPGTISCPVCLDSYSEIVESGRLVVSTRCGHVFCSQCVRDALSSSHSCPTCRKKLTPRQYHPLYI